MARPILVVAIGFPKREKALKNVFAGPIRPISLAP
jgi:hypothetical protein